MYLSSWFLNPRFCNQGIPLLLQPCYSGCVRELTNQVYVNSLGGALVRIGAPLSYAKERTDSCPLWNNRYLQFQLNLFVSTCHYTIFYKNLHSGRRPILRRRSQLFLG